MHFNKKITILDVNIWVLFIVAILAIIKDNHEIIFWATNSIFFMIVIQYLKNITDILMAQGKLHVFNALENIKNENNLTEKDLKLAYEINDIYNIAHITGYWKGYHDGLQKTK